MRPFGRRSGGGAGRDFDEALGRERAQAEREGSPSEGNPAPRQNLDVGSVEHDEAGARIDLTA